jgi:alkaline phosphatase
MASRRTLVAVASLVLACTCTCTRTRELPPCDPSPALPPPQDPSVAVVAVAGDIAECPSGLQSQTAILVDRIAPDAVFTLGDTVYPNGSLDEFLDCYDATWGRFRGITRPVVGNHEYHAPHAGPFFAYFCGAAGPPFLGRTSFDVGAWHVVVLNSNCGGDADVPSSTPGDFGGCGADADQAHWLRDDLAAHPAHCTAAMWHHPRYSSGPYGQATAMSDTWRILHDAGADLVLSGHAHLYERFAPMDADGNVDPARGMREIVVGTGGKVPLSTIAAVATGSEAVGNQAHGVLRLELRSGGYAWHFMAVDGDSFADDGEAACHD